MQLLLENVGDKVDKLQDQFNMWFLLKKLDIKKYPTKIFLY